MYGRSLIVLGVILWILAKVILPLLYVLEQLLQSCVASIWFLSLLFCKWQFCVGSLASIQHHRLRSNSLRYLLLLELVG